VATRGTKEAVPQLALLRAKWPLAFALEEKDVRPLATGAAREIAAVMDWSLPYTLLGARVFKPLGPRCEGYFSFGNGCQAIEIARARFGRVFQMRLEIAR
jgi:hypothetical protein